MYYSPLSSGTPTPQFPPPPKFVGFSRIAHALPPFAKPPQSGQDWDGDFSCPKSPEEFLELVTDTSEPVVPELWNWSFGKLKDDEDAYDRALAVMDVQWDGGMVVICRRDADGSIDDHHPWYFSEDQIKTFEWIEGGFTIKDMQGFELKFEFL